MLNPPDTFRILFDLTNQHQIGTASHAAQDASSSDEKSGANCRRRTSFYDQRSSDSVDSMTNFTPEEITSVWLLMAEQVARYWITGRRAKSRVSGEDVLYMLPSALKHEQQ